MATTKPTETEDVAGTQPDPEVSEPTYTFPAYRLAEAKTSIKRANSRLTRAGIADQFTYEIERYNRAVPVPGDQQTLEMRQGIEPATKTIAMVRLTLSTPTIALGGWTFVATLDQGGDGVVARTVPGQDLHGWRPENLVCDHCHTARARKNTYVVRHEDGRQAQVGHNCLAVFLGIRPQGLWALGWEPDLGEGGGEHEGYGTGPVLEPVEWIVALALATSDNGAGYVSRAAVQGHPDRTSTADVVRWVLGANPKSEEDRRRRAGIVTAASGLIADGTVATVLEEGRSLAGDSDYETNLRTLLATDHIEDKHIGLVASLASVHHRLIEQRVRDQARAEQRAAAAKGFIADVEAKVSNVRATVTNRRLIEGYYGTTTLLIMSTDDGHVLKWFASGSRDHQPGDVVTITSATVKEHEHYEGVDQTVLTRARIATQ